MIAGRSVVLEVRDIAVAIEPTVSARACSCGRRKPVCLATGRLGCTSGVAAQGQAAVSTDGLTTWQPTCHCSLFYNIYRFIAGQGCRTIEAIVKRYRFVWSTVQLHADEPVLSLMRASTRVRGFDARLLQMTDDCVPPMRRALGRARDGRHAPLSSPAPATGGELLSFTPKSRAAFPPKFFAPLP
ncbi:FlhC family transcriptional regulator [Paraburkholderia sp.]|uniref:FlhC family transcriptional regulator n=1 Tax=Paraburkholderia sp. TaxID=1926495 RepID=UPI002F419F88